MEANNRRRRRKEEEVEKNPKYITTIPHIPEDVLRNIFLRLPVRSLLALKGLRPSWRDLISDSHFIKQHLDQANKGRGNVGLCQIFRIKPFTVNLTVIDSKASKTKTTELSPHFKYSGDSVKILGSCNGLILIRISLINLLWNPTTGEYTKVANHCWQEKEYNDNHFENCIYGLGYDSWLDEYKSVFLVAQHEMHEGRFGYTHKTEVGSNMFICRTSVGSWNEVSDGGVHDFGIRCSKQLGITVNGSPHWVVSDSKEDNKYSPCRTIVYFDMGDEKFKRLPTPLLWDEIVGTVSNYGLSLLPVEMGVLDGCVVCSTRIDVGKGDFDVWVMKEYGVAESWDKLFVIQRPSDNLTWNVMPLGFTNNGTQVVVHADSGTLITYNIDTREEKIIINSNTFRRALYVESLVSPAAMEK